MQLVVEGAYSSLSQHAVFAIFANPPPNSISRYLHKLGATFHGWSRRWFLFDRQKMAFIYFADKSERKPRGGAYFSVYIFRYIRYWPLLYRLFNNIFAYAHQQTIDEVYLDHMNTSKSGRPHCTFIVKTKKRSYHLQAASDAAARIWIDAVITGAQGNIDYWPKKNKQKNKIVSYHIRSMFKWGHFIN